MKIHKIRVTSEYRAEQEFTDPNKAWRYYSRQVRRAGGDMVDLKVKKYGFNTAGHAEFYDIVKIEWI